MPAIDQDAMISTADVRVDYDDVTAVRDLNLSIGPGEVFGLIGPNGAGKTSTIRVLATLLEPTYGDVFVGGFDAAEQPEKVHRILGYMPDLAPVCEDLKCWEFLDLFAHAHHLPRRERRQRIDHLLAEVDLSSKRDAMAGTLSRGMKQRLVLAKTLLHEPKVLLLDEPASGLDPLARVELRNTIKRLAARGTTVLVSSHILTELTDLCTSIGIMQRGLIVQSGRVEQIVEALRPHVTLVIELLDEPDAAELAAKVIDADSHCRAVERDNGRLLVDFDGDGRAIAGLLASLVNAGAPVRSYSEKRMGIEDIFLKVGAREVS